jgi:hypothetical protein
MMKHRYLALFYPLFLFFFVILLAQKGIAQEKFFTPEIPPKVLYEIEAEIDQDANVIKGTEKIIFANHSSKPIHFIAIDWAHSESSSIEVHATDKEVKIAHPGKGHPFASPILYKLSDPMKLGEEIELDVTFCASDVMNKKWGNIQILRWHPRLWWDSKPTFDSYKVKVEAPSGYAMAVSGRYNDQTSFYENDGVRSMGLFLLKGGRAEFKDVEEVRITSLFDEESEECAQFCLFMAEDVVRFYKNWLGFYPFRFLYIIPGSDTSIGGYPFATGIIAIHGQKQFRRMPLSHWKWITAHEIGHQYWGEYVIDGDNPGWLWIGLGIYADREYSLFRSIRLDKHKDFMRRYLDGVKNHLDTTVDIPPDRLKTITFDRNNIVTHGKGYSIISALECVLGKETFENIYRKCLQEFGGKRLDYRKFWEICEFLTGEDFDWFFEQWVRSNRYLAYEIISQKCTRMNENYVSEIVVERIGSLRMPIPIQTVFEDGSTQIQWTQRFLDRNILEFKSKSPLKSAALDPEGKLAMLESRISNNRL